MAERGGGVDRRWVVGALLGTAVLPAAGCGIRLEDDAPRVPLVPTRTPLAAEALLVALTRDCLVLADAAAALPGDLAADLAALHRRQHSVLRTTLVRRQVPAEEVDGAPSSPTPTPSSSPPTSPSASPSASATAGATEGRAALAAAEGKAAAGAAELAGVPADMRATVAALLAQRFAAATLVAGRPPEVPTDPVAGATVASAVALTEGAVWLLEVVAARSTGRQRARSDATLEVLRALRTDQLAGGARSESALGHPLPFPVESTADAARLAREVLAALRADLGALLDPLVADHGGPGLAAATRWLGAVEVEAHRWGVDLAPFPGLA